VEEGKEIMKQWDRFHSPSLTLLAVVLPWLPGCVRPAREDDTQRHLKATASDLQWFRDARFGMFVHWGPVSLKGTEISWSRAGPRPGMKSEPSGTIPVDVYDNLYKQFNPTSFDARQWVAIARSAGMKYLVFTTKHHDGFCMFDSRLTDYKITHTPFKRDVTAELAAACHEAGLKLGFYYSPPDWHHPDYRTKDHARYVKYMHGQLRELCTGYGRVDIIWFDGLYCTAADWDSENLFAMIRRLQPGVLINDRAGLPGDYNTPEQEIGKFQTARPWESCITIGKQWSYDPHDKIKSRAEILQTLAQCAGRDGNLLFNVGPTPTGEIEPTQAERLRQVGEWLTRYGQTIYGTRGGPFVGWPWGVSTYQGNTVYLHVFNWPGEIIELPASGSSVVSCSALTGGTATMRQTTTGVEIRLPVDRKDEPETIISLVLDRPAAEIQPIKPERRKGVRNN